MAPKFRQVVPHPPIGRVETSAASIASIYLVKLPYKWTKTYTTVKVCGKLKDNSVWTINFSYLQEL